MANSANPYGKISMAFKYWKYRRKAVGRSKVHSPFVYEFANEVLRRTSKARNRKIEAERKRLKSSVQTIDFVDYGKNGTSFKKKVSDIAKNSLKPKKYAELIGRICQFYPVKNALELGTSLGITTAYMAEHAEHVTTMEGSDKVLLLAESIWGYLGLENITTKDGSFEQHLGSLGEEQFDVIFMDGNHQLDPSLRYFEQLQANAHSTTIFIVDDINWSEDMQTVWSKIKEHEKVTTTIDLFALGIVFINPELSKEHFLLKF
jgi:predicted O-methyltransferase YrrM